MKKLYLFPVLVVFFVSFFLNKATAQQVTITDDASYTPNSSTILDVHSKNGDLGMLIPQVTLNDASTSAPITSPATGLLIYNNGGSEPDGYYFWEGTKWDQLYSGDVPSIPGNTEFWIRPSGAKYIRPEFNAKARVFDAGQHWGFYYEGSNRHGAFFAGDDVGVIGQRAGTDTSAVPTFIGDQYPFVSSGGDDEITSVDDVTYSGVYGYGNLYVGVTGIATWDAGVRGIGLAESDYGTNSSWPVVGVMGEVVSTGSDDYGQQGVYGWQAASAGSDAFCSGVVGRTSQTGYGSGGVTGYYTSSVGSLSSCFSSPVVFGTLGYGQGCGVYGYTSSSSYWAGYFYGDVKVIGDMYASNYYKSSNLYYTKGTLNTIEDFGSATLKKGVSKIIIDYDLLDMADKSQDYKVYIQLTSENQNGVYVKKYQDYFEVIENNKGQSNTSFDWRLVVVKKTSKVMKKQIQNTLDELPKSNIPQKVE